MKLEFQVLLVWAIALIVCLAIAAVFGEKLNKNVCGVFIDTRCTWSFAHFQLGLWFLIIAPLYATVLFRRILDDAQTALNVTIPVEVLTLMGLSAGTTLVASGIKYQKIKKHGALAAAERIRVRNDSTEASFFDMLAYDEGREALKGLDVTKLQSFVFNLFVGLAYLVATLFIICTKDKAPDTLPDIAGSIPILLGLSQVGYLAGKAIPQSGSPEGTTAADKTAKEATKKAAAASSGDGDPWRTAAGHGARQG